MGLPVLIMGESGSGKTYSVKNLPPEEVAVLLCEKNRLPFKKEFRTYKVKSGTGAEGKIVRQAQVVYAALKKASRKIYIIDELWEASHNSSYEKCIVMGSTSLKVT